MAADVTDSQTLTVTSSKASGTTGSVAEIAANETETVTVTFTPTKPPNWYAQEVYGTTALLETCFGAVEFIDGTRVQHTHDQRLYRLLEELLLELRELRISEKGA